jgi:hypothetical protein
MEGKHDTSWQEEFLEMKTHQPEVVRLLMEAMLSQFPLQRSLPVQRIQLS